MNIVKLVGPVCISFALLFGLAGCSSDQVDEIPEEAKTIETGSASPKQTTTLVPVTSVTKEPSEVKKTAPTAKAAKTKKVVDEAAGTEKGAKPLSKAAKPRKSGTK